MQLEFRCFVRVLSIENPLFEYVVLTCKVLAAVRMFLVSMPRQTCFGHCQALRQARALKKRQDKKRRQKEKKQRESAAKLQEAADRRDARQDEVRTVEGTDTVDASRARFILFFFFAVFGERQATQATEVY